MKILKTNSFVSERIKIKPVTNAELDKIEKQANNKITNDTIEKDLTRLFFNDCEITKNYYIKEQDIIAEINRFMMDSISRKKRDKDNAAETFCREAQKNKGMFYFNVLRYAGAFSGHKKEEILITVDLTKTKDNVYCLYGEDGSFSMSGEDYYEGHVYMKIDSYNPYDI